MNQPETIAITRSEARVLQDILRHIHTSNRAVQDATFQMFAALQHRLDAPRRVCECDNTPSQRN